MTPRKPTTTSKTAKQKLAAPIAPVTPEQKTLAAKKRDFSAMFDVAGDQDPTPQPTDFAPAPATEPGEAKATPAPTESPTPTIEAPATSQPELQPQQAPSPEAPAPGTPTPTAATVTPVPTQAPAGQPIDPLLAAIERADALLAEQGLTAAPPKESTKQYVVYPIEGTREAFMTLRDQLNLSNAAMVRMAVNDNIAALTDLMGPQASQHLIAGYRPRPRKHLERKGISLRVTDTDLDLYTKLTERWPGCRSINDLLSTAIELAVREIC